MTDQGWIEVWRQPDGFWRWRYRNPGDEIDLLANESHSTLREAERSARLAYPTVRDMRVRRRPRRDLGAWARRLAILAFLLWVPRRLFRALRRLRAAGKIVRFLRSG